MGTFTLSIGGNYPELHEQVLCNEITVADPEGVQGVRSNPLPIPTPILNIL